MQTIQITSGEQNVTFTSKSVTIDGKEYPYRIISGPTISEDGQIYAFRTEDGRKEITPLPADRPVLDAIFRQLQAMPQQHEAARNQGDSREHEAARDPKKDPHHDGTEEQAAPPEPETDEKNASPGSILTRRGVVFGECAVIILLAAAGVYLLFVA